MCPGPSKYTCIQVTLLLTETEKGSCLSLSSQHSGILILNGDPAVLSAVET